MSHVKIDTRGERLVMTEREHGAMHLPAQDCQSPPERGKGKEGFFIAGSQEHGPADTLISHCYSLQNYETIDFGSFQPVGLECFVAAALGT